MALKSCEAVLRCPPVIVTEAHHIGSEIPFSSLQVVSAAVAEGEQPKLEGLLVCDSWKKELDSEFSKPYMLKLQSYLQEQWTTAKVFPPAYDIFRALNTVPFDR